MTRPDYAAIRWEEDDALRWRDPERISICGICGDVAPCELHPEDPASEMERLASEVARFGGVLTSVRALLSAWESSDGLPDPLHRALTDLDSSVARYDRLPF